MKVEEETEEYMLHSEAYEQVGRFVEDALGSRQIVRISVISWRYLDWLESIGADVKGYISACDSGRGTIPFDSALEEWVKHAYEGRERLGLPRPSWCPPLQPELLPDED